MKAKSMNAIWGLALVIAGVLFLAQNMGWIGEIPGQLWKFIFAGLSLLFFTTYFINGVRAWGWLFPACIFAALSVITTLGDAGSDSPVLGSMMMWSIAAPFLVAFGLETKKKWWALIPAWVLIVIGGLIVLEGKMPDEVFAGLILFSIALPFLVVYLTDRSRWWALIPGGVLIVVAFIPLIASTASEEFIPVFIMLIISLPFFVVYMASNKNWWALIPAGIMVTIAVGLLVMFALGEDNPLNLRVGGVFFLGWGATFGALWLRRAVHDTDWAKWPAGILAALGLGIIVFGSGFNMLWPVLVIAAGVVVLFYALRRK
jgi:hypothetical protein